MEYNKKYLNNSNVFHTRILYDNLLNHMGTYFNITFHRKHARTVKTFKVKINYEWNLQFSKFSLDLYNIIDYIGTYNSLIVEFMAMRKLTE